MDYPTVDRRYVAREAVNSYRMVSMLHAFCISFKVDLPTYYYEFLGYQLKCTSTTRGISRYGIAYKREKAQQRSAYNIYQAITNPLIYTFYGGLKSDYGQEVDSINNIQNAVSRIIFLYLDVLLKKFKGHVFDLKHFRKLIVEYVDTKLGEVSTVKYFCVQNLYHEAQFWLDYYDLPLRYFDAKLRPLLRKKCDCSDFRLSDISFKNRDYLKLTLSPEVVVSNYGFNVMMQHLTKQSIIAFDVEWKIEFNDRPQTTAIVQIASKSRVFIIDCLNKSITKQNWKYLGTNVFSNNTILKLGFSMTNDIRLLEKLVGTTINNRDKFFDISLLWKRIKVLHLYARNPGGNGLADCVQHILGKPLSKADQCSNWNIRPLRKEQLEYAALDAYCLLLLYENIKQECIKNTWNFERLQNEIIYNPECCNNSGSRRRSRRKRRK